MSQGVFLPYPSEKPSGFLLGPAGPSPEDCQEALAKAEGAKAKLVLAPWIVGRVARAVSRCLAVCLACVWHFVVRLLLVFGGFRRFSAVLFSVCCCFFAVFGARRVPALLRHACLHAGWWRVTFSWRFGEHFLPGNVTNSWFGVGWN